MINKRYVDLAIIGGGPAGLAAAVGAYDKGLRDILVIERDEVLGGILNQCIHNGFGLHTFKEELTGPEYANRYECLASERNIECLKNTTVISLANLESNDKHNKKLLITGPKTGLEEVYAKAVILAMGCRERPRGALNIPGFRPAGVYSAGTAQKLVNIDGYMPGKKVVILGSGDIGLIMARRMTLEGAKVLFVAELLPYSGGLKRNIVQCLDDFNIPLKLSYTVTKIHGHDRVEGVTISKVDENFKVIEGTDEYYECDTLLLSVGLLPTNELSIAAGVKINPVTRGAVVQDDLMTSVEGVFACGNVLHVHDLVDYVSQESKLAGESAVDYINNLEANNIQDNKEIIEINTVDGVRYSVPTFIRKNNHSDNITIRFRVSNVFENKYVSVYFDDVNIKRAKKMILAPGEMEQIVLRKNDFDKKKDVEKITIRIED